MTEDFERVLREAGIADRMDERLHVAGPAVVADPPLDRESYLGDLYEGHMQMWRSDPKGQASFDPHLGWRQWCHLCGLLLQPRSSWAFDAGAVVFIDEHGMWHEDRTTFWEFFGVPARLCMPGIEFDPLPGPEHLGIIDRPSARMIARYGRPYPVVADLDPELRPSYFSIYRSPE